MQIIPEELNLQMVDELAKNSFNKVLKLQRQLHKIPEPGMQEMKTSQFIKDYLSEEGITYKVIPPTGIIADFGKQGHRIALRADMDALRIKEEADVPWASEHTGYMHACGHDGHTAALLGIAGILKQHETLLNIQVRLIFQPSEENCQGAKLMTGKGALDGVEEVYGLHLFTDIPEGIISLDAGPRMAVTDRFSVKLTGKGGHAGKPEQCIDATVAGAAIIMNSQTIVSRRINPVDSAVLTIGHFTSGSQYNAISREAFLEGTVRTFSDETEQQMKRDFENIVMQTAAAYGVEADIDYHPSEHPVVYNDKKLSERLQNSAKRLWGENAVREIPKMMLGEDFSVYQSYVPGVFAFVGAGNKDDSCVYPNHHPRFKLDDRSLKWALSVYLLYIIQRNGDLKND